MQISILNDEKKEWVDKATALEKRCNASDEEIKHFREENQRLREELQSLRALVRMYDVRCTL